MSTAEESAPLLRSDSVEEIAAEEHNAERRSDTPMLVLAVVGLLTLAITTWTIVLTHNPANLSWFAYHPPLQTLSVLLFGCGILTLQPTSKADLVEKKRGLTRHQIFNFALGFPAIIAGSTFMIYNKASHGAAHFTTWHSVFGLISLAWLILQVLVGAGSAWFGGAAFGGGDKAKRLYKYHRLSGYLLLVSLLFTCHLAGAWSDWVVYNTRLPERIIGYSIAPILVVIGVFARIRVSKMQF